jgi:protein ImuA
MLTPSPEVKKELAAEPAIESLRAQIAKIEGRDRRAKSVLPFGIAEVDLRLPGGGMARGALHEIAGGGNGAIDGAAAALFAAGIAARTKGKVLSCIAKPDLFAPALAQAGLAPDRVIYVGGRRRQERAGLHGGRVAPQRAGRGRRRGRSSIDDDLPRLQPAAEGTGSIGISIQRWQRQTEAADFGQPTAATTRWRISVLPSTPLPVPGVGRHRWLVELIRARAGESADFKLEACDDTGRLTLPADLVHRRCGGRLATRRLRLRRRSS